MFLASSPRVAGAISYHFNSTFNDQQPLAWPEWWTLAGA
ncbi:DUF1010 domain-containing protein [Simplicispira sp.]